MKLRAREELEERRESLGTMIQMLRESIEKAPDGKIYTSCSNGVQQYYFMEQGRKKYIPAAKKESALSIVQREYDERLLRICQKEYKAIDRFLRSFHPEIIEEFIQSLSPARKKTVDLRYVSAEQFAAQVTVFATEQYKRKENTYPPSDRFTTRQGVCVRSKSELIIANMLDRHGLQYYYELPLETGPDVWAFPDFTVVDVSRRRLVYWEHFGLTDDFGYSSKMAAKLNAYERIGIFPGDNLIMTMESRDCPLDVGMVKVKIDRCLLR